MFLKCIVSQFDLLGIILKDLECIARIINEDLGKHIGEMIIKILVLILNLRQFLFEH